MVNPGKRQMCELEENCIHIYTKFTFGTVSETTGKMSKKSEDRKSKLLYAFSNMGTISSNSRDAIGIVNSNHSVNNKHNDPPQPDCYVRYYSNDPRSVLKYLCRMEESSLIIWSKSKTVPTNVTDGCAGHNSVPPKIEYFIVITMYNRNSTSDILAVTFLYSAGGKGPR